MSNAVTASRILTVGGGKGGVGKSIVALNLAATFAQMGKRVVIADMDLGAANQHLLLGITRTRTGLQSLLDKTAEDPDEVLTPTSVPNLSLLAGTSAVLGAANIGRAQKKRLVRKLRSLRADVVVVDVGAGVGYNVLDFFALGGQKILVTTPQVTAIHDAYSFLKGAVLRVLHDCAEEDIEAALLAPVERSDSAEKVVDLLEHLRQVRPSLADKAFAQINRFGALMVGNQVTNATQAGVFRSVSKMVRDYLALDMPVLGWLPASPRVNDSVNRRRPLVLDGAIEESQLFRRFAGTLLAEPVAEDEADVEIDVDLVDEADGAKAAAPTPPRHAKPSAAPPPVPRAPRGRTSSPAPATTAPPAPPSGRSAEPPRARNTSSRRPAEVADPPAPLDYLPGMPPRAAR